MVYILIFNSVHRVMKAEKLLKSAAIPFKTIPVPRKLSSDCGLAIRVSDVELSTLKDALKKEPAEEIYLEENGSYRRLM